MRRHYASLCRVSRTEYLHSFAVRAMYLAHAVEWRCGLFPDYFGQFCLARSADLPTGLYILNCCCLMTLLSMSALQKYMYIDGYFVASFPYFNGTAFRYTLVSVNQRKNEVRAYITMWSQGRFYSISTLESSEGQGFPKRAGQCKNSVGHMLKYAVLT